MTANMVGLSLRVKDLKPSETLGVTAKAKELKARGLDVVDLGVGEPDFPTPENVKAAAIRAIEENFTYYTPASGIWELREAVAQKLRDFNDLDYDPREICISCGAKQSIYNALQALLDPGDEVLIPVPFWVSYPAQVTLTGGVPKYIPTGKDYKLTPELLEENITDKTKILILNYPSNPSGVTYEGKELNEIADAILPYNLIVISDEVYEYFTYDGVKHVSFASINEEAYRRTVTVNALSKTYSMTGWRIGYSACPLDMAEAISKIQSHTTSNTTSISQKAALEALTGPQEYVSEMVKTFSARRRFILERIRGIEGLRCMKPDGAFYVFPELSDFKVSSSEFSSRLLEEGLVATIPGEAFGSPKNFRISYSASMADLMKGMDRLEKFCSQLRME
ncbi:MAG: pyridoxal phosphate-dependent aminotransferase [Candidatus Bathyarchaeia archaeon]